MRNGEKIQERLRHEGSDERKRILSRFFKTGTGEYGEGDKFLGVTVPTVREIIKDYKKTATLEDVEYLITSPYHEERLAALLLLVAIYSRCGKKGCVYTQEEILNYYLSMLKYGNNWDLVDLVAPKILGEYIKDNPENSGILYELADMDNSLWHQRVAMVSTWSIIRVGRYEEALNLATKFISHSHDLIHKASGWMLREIGKRGGMHELLAFLDKYSPVMPRTMLRYSIEKLDENQRKYYLNMRKNTD